MGRREQSDQLYLTIEWKILLKKSMFECSFGATQELQQIIATFFSFFNKQFFTKQKFQ
jgi:hypothetical protein